MKIKKLVLTSFIASFAMLSFSQKKVAVFDPTGIDDDVVIEVAREVLINNIISSDNYVLLEREQISQVMKENQYQSSGLVDDSQISEIGKQAGAEYVCVGTVKLLGSKYFFSARLVDVVTAQASVSGQSSNADVFAALEEAASKMVGSKGKKNVVITLSEMPSFGKSKEEKAKEKELAEAKAKQKAMEKELAELKRKQEELELERIKVEAREKALADAREKAKADAAEKARLEAEREVREQLAAEAKAKLLAEKEEKERAEAKEKARLRAEREAREQVAAEEAARKAAEEEAAELAREAQKAIEAAETQAEKERLAAEAKEKARLKEEARAKEKARLRAEREAREQAAREEEAREEAEALARVKAREEAKAQEKARLKAEKEAREKAAIAAKLQEEADEKAREEAEAKAKEDAKIKAAEIAAAKERAEKMERELAEEQARQDKMEKELASQAKVQTSQPASSGLARIFANRDASKRTVSIVTDGRAFKEETKDVVSATKKLLGDNYNVASDYKLPFQVKPTVKKWSKYAKVDYVINYGIGAGKKIVINIYNSNKGEFKFFYTKFKADDPSIDANALIEMYKPYLDK